MNARHRAAARPHARPTAGVAALLLALLALGASVGGLLPSATAAARAPGALAPATVEDGSIEIQLLEAPESRRDDPRALAYIIDHLRPGSTIERRFAVTNNTGERQRVQLYPGPAEIVDGQFVGGDAGSSNELTSWVSTSLPFVGLAPGESTEQTVRIEVPADASRGERYAVLWASVRARGQATVRVVNRVGIRIYLDVGRGGEPASDFTVDEIVPGRNEAGQPTLSASVTNTGGRALDVRGEVRLRQGPGGLSAGPFDVASGTTLAPGDEGTVDIALDKGLPAGPWRAKFVLRSGELERRSSATVTFPEAGQGAPVTASSDDTDGASGGGPWGEPWFLVLLAAGLGALLLALVQAVRRWRRPSTAAGAPAVEEGSPTAGGPA